MGKPWFAPKRYGYGTSLPIAWQGWMVMLGFIAAVILVVTVTPTLLPTALVAPVTICANAVLIALVAGIAKAKTAGGWRWRWGEGP